MADSDNSGLSDFAQKLKAKLANAFAPADARADQQLQEDRDSIRQSGGDPYGFKNDQSLTREQKLRKIQKGFTGE